MTGFIFDIKRYAVHDGPGIRTTVFFKGCPLSCWWCHNPESQRKLPEQAIRQNKLDDKIFDIQETYGKAFSVNEVVKEIEKDRMFHEDSGGGVTISGGEPFMQPAFLDGLVSVLKEHDYHVAIDTTGYVAENVLEQIAPNTDLFLFDLKHMDSAQHRKYTGVPNETILKNLYWLSANKHKLFIRIPVIPGVNDNGNIEQSIDFLNNLPNKPLEVDLLPYHKIAGHKYEKFGMNNKMDGFMEPTSEKMNELKNKFIAAGFKTKIGG